jgi:hypothetical protein
MNHCAIIGGRVRRIHPTLHHLVNWNFPGRRYEHDKSGVRQTITALLVIDPYNDFISEGGKIWDRIKKVQKAMIAFRTCCKFCRRQGRQQSTFSMRCIIDTVQATTRPGSTLPPSRKRAGCARSSNTERGVARSAASSSLKQATSGPGALVFEQICQYRSGFAAQEAWHSQAHRHWAHRTHLRGGHRPSRRRTWLRGHASKGCDCRLFE